MLGEAQSLVETFYSSEVMEAPDGGSKLPAMVVWGNLAIYIVAWGLLMWPQHLPLGRPCIAMVFAAMAAGLRELCHKAWPEKDYPSLDIFGKINPTPIALLFGLMLVNAYLQDTGLWKHVERVVDSVSPRVLLVKVCVFAAATSALLTNDTTCLMLTPLVLKLCARRGARDVQPYLMAVATSSNIGSSLTIIGNPQNALIASISPGMSFLGFMKDMLLPTVLGLVLNTSALYLYYRRVLAFDQPGESDVEVATVIEHRCAWGLYAVGVGVVVVAMLVGWILNMNTDEVALAAGSTLMLLRALRRRYSGEDAKEKDTETRFALGAIDYPILVLFIGQFILVGATVDTGLPQRLFRLILGPCAGHLAQSPVCLLWFAGVVLLLSNVISNVPVILMLQPLLASQPHAVRQIWTVCAWTATVSGNLTLMGSAGNLIVAHVAEAQDVPFTATSYSKFALIPTLVITALGVLLLPPLGPSWAWLVGACMAALLLLGGLCRARREPALLECTA